MKRPARPVLAWASVVAIIAVAAGRASAQVASVESPLGDYGRSPVFFERFADDYIDMGTLPELRRGVVRLWNYDPVDLSHFDWRNGGLPDPTWWLQVEELRFLMPLIASDRDDDHARAERWFRAWYRAYATGKQNDAAWKDPMTVAWRGMTMVYFLKREQERGNDGSDLAGLLRSAIYEHIEFLMQEYHFNSQSNHGLIEALALLEMARVFPNTETTATGARRLLRLVRASVSASGAHMEHAPYYHFAFLRWLDQCVDYLPSLSDIGASTVTELVHWRDLMRHAGYFLQDHDGDVPQIGDGDSTSVAFFSPRFRIVTPPPGGPVYFDEAAGYAIYKGDTAGDRRYVVFCTQDHSPALHYHFHADALAVYADDDGEVLLGESGKFEYRWGPERQYYFSPPAHNTVCSLGEFEYGRSKYNPTVARKAFDESDQAAVRFRALLVEHKASVERRVDIPRVQPPAGRDRVVAAVSDVLRGRPGGGFGDSLVTLWHPGRDVVALERDGGTPDSVMAWTMTTRRGRVFQLSITVTRGFAGAGVTCRLARGERSPMLGWYSPRHLVERPATMIVIVCAPAPEVDMETRLTGPDRPAHRYWRRLFTLGF